jgi:glutamyl-tRNA reductase
MQLSLIGINNQTAPVSIREKLAISDEMLPETLLRLKMNVQYGVVLSTCNRTEIYLAGTNPADMESAGLNFLSDCAAVSRNVLKPYVDIMTGRALVEHLFRVACGLNSMVIGEHEVLGQVRQALASAEKAGMVNLPLRHIFQSAIGAGRSARDETGISRNAVSVSSIAMNKAMDIVPDIRLSKLVVIGAGEAGRLALKVAAGRGATNIVVMSRTEERAVRLTHEFGGKPSSTTRLGQELIDTDIVFGCAASPHAIVRVPHVIEVMSKRPGRPLIIIDIAVPRNVDPAVGDIKGVHLYNIDDLIGEADNNRSQRELEIAAVERVVSREVELAMKWWQAYNVRPAIKALMAKAEKIRSGQFEKTIGRLSDLTDDEKQAVEMLTTSIVDKILHDPILYLKSDSDGNVLRKSELVRQIFKLGEGKGYE